MKLRKISGILLAVAVAVGAVSIPAFASSSVTDDWDGTADTSWYTTASEDATEYYLDSAEDLAGLASLVNSGTSFAGKTVKLMVNVELNDVTAEGVTEGQQEWTPIGGALAGKSFNGIFDGNNNTIYNIYYSHSDGDYSKGNSVKNNIGLFGNIDQGATVKNVTLDGGYIGAQRSVGAIVGKNWGNIYNCRNVDVEVYSTDSKGLGGIAGASWSKVMGGTVLPEIKNCTNSGYIHSSYSKASVGGIAGENEGVVDSCNNYGTINSSYNTGGIAGYNAKTGSINNSGNTGKLSGTSCGNIIGYDEATGGSVN